MGSNIKTIIDPLTTFDNAVNSSRAGFLNEKIKNESMKEFINNSNENNGNTNILSNIIVNKKPKARPNIK